MIRKSLAVLAISVVAGLAGCSSAGPGTSAAIPEEMAPTQLAAFSAKAEYPQTQPSDNFPVAAIVNKGAGTVAIFNFSNQPIGEGKIWVNHSFVYHVFGIPPQSKVVINVKDLYDNLGNSFAAQKNEVSSVQLQTDHRFYNVEGPALE